MAKRTVAETIETGVQRLVPKGAPALVRQAKGFRIDRLRDELPGINAACNALNDTDFVHRSVAAIYCRRSESVIDRHLLRVRKQPRFKAEMVKHNVNEVPRGAKAPVYFRVDLLKLLTESIRNAQDDGEDARSKKLQRRRAHAMAATANPPLTLADVDTEQLWLTDEQGRVYVRVSLVMDGRIHLANVFRKNGRIELLTFRTAIAERDWVHPRAHAKQLAIYLALLDGERAAVLEMSEIAHRRALAQRLDRAVRHSNVEPPRRFRRL